MTEREQIRAEIKKQLNSYKDLRAERQQIRDELERLEISMDAPSGSNFDGMPKAPGVSNPVERAVTRLVMLQDRYKEKLQKMAEAQIAIEDMLEGLEPTERRLARFRYVDGLTWEDVCDKMNYSWRQTHRIHGRMLDRLVTAELERRNPQT